MDTVTRKQIYDLYADFVSRFSCDPVLVRNVRRTRQALEMANIESSNTVKDVPIDEASASSRPASDSQGQKEEDEQKEHEVRHRGHVAPCLHLIALSEVHQRAGSSRMSMNSRLLASIM